MATNSYDAAYASNTDSLVSSNAFVSNQRWGKSDAGFYSNIDPGISVRPPFGREDYNYFRPNEAVPNGKRQGDYRRIISMCVAAYESVGVIKSVIDLMSEFSAEGIEIIHEDESPNEFYKAWSKKINLNDRAERYASWLFKGGNVVVRRQFGNVDTSSVRKLKVQKNTVNAAKINPGYIPLGYKFYNPAGIEIVGGAAGSLSDKKVYGIKIPVNMLESFYNPKNKMEQEVFDGLPQEIKDAVKLKRPANAIGTMIIPIPEDKIYVAHYKKDDSDVWAKPFLYAILDNVNYNNKIKLAKISGLDGWHNVLRLWKLGDHTREQYPSPALFAKLSSILEQNSGAGATDIIWRSDIACEEFYPPIDKLAGLEEDIEGILLGLGVPSSLAGGKETSAGGQNGFMGLKNIISKIDFARRSLTDWLEAEIDIIQANMGFKKRPYIRFSNTNLHDERTIFNLLIQLADRSIISNETVLDRITEVYGVEKVRLYNEEQGRKDGSVPEKASPFHRPDAQAQRNHEIKKIVKQAEVNQDTSGDGGGMNSYNESKKVGKMPRGRGRPAGTKDSNTRQKRGNVVKSYNELLLYANKTYSFIEDWTKQNMLEMCKASSIRNLTAEQERILDESRIQILSAIEPDYMVDDETMAESLVTKDVAPIRELSLKNHSSASLTYEEKKMLRIAAYVSYWSEVLELGY